MICLFRHRTVCLLVLLAGCAAVSAAEPAPRVTLCFNPEWRFIKADPAGANQVKFDDSAWTTVSCPHTYNDIDTFDDLSPGQHIGELTQWQGRTWYRKHFHANPAWRGKRVFIEFQAIRQVGEVYLNGTLLGKSESGFTPFGFDLTPHLRFDAENVLAVMCDNTFVSHGSGAFSAEVNGLPWNDPHWHPAHGGIYRDVYLHVTEPVHITLPLYNNLGTEGTYVYATDSTADSVTLTAEAEVQNETAAEAPIECTSEVLDHDGNSVLTLTTAGTVAAGEKHKFIATGKLQNPQRWEPAYPYLYRVVTTIGRAGKAIDCCETPLGIRSCQYSVTDGFSINGHSLKLHGWGQKPTDEWPGLGSALPDWLHDFTLKLMKDAGGNYLRWGHCAAGLAEIEPANRYGIITLQPGVDGEADCTGHAWDVRSAAFRDVLIYFRNQPAICLWETGNQKMTDAHIQQLAGYKNQWDPHGGRVLINRRSDATVCKYIDVSEGTEGGHECPDHPVVEGEYDREESPRRVWDNFSPPDFGYLAGKGQTYNLNSEQFAVNQATQYAKIAAASHCGGAKWIFSDSTSGGRMTCEVARVSGNVDAARLPKEAYYAVQTIFHDDPQVHIVGHWSYPAKTIKPIYVLSNCQEVELFLNNKSVGKGTPSQGYVFTFPNVTYERGTLRAVGYDEGNPVASHEYKTAGPPRRLKLTPIAGPAGLRADGSDVVLVDVEAVDADGNRSPTFQARVDFTLTGPAIWRGGYNSGKAKSTNNTFLDLECGINRVAIRSTLQPGILHLQAAATGLEPASLELPSHALEISEGMTTELPQVPVQAPLSHPKAIMPRRFIAATTEPAEANHGLITGFSYTGPTRAASVQPIAGGSIKPFSDRSLQISDLPKFLHNAEFIQAPCDDTAYSALDLMQFSTNAAIDLYIAHDDRLPPPQWLTHDFKTTGQQLSLGNAKATLFKRTLPKGAAVTLGGNTDDRPESPGLMYIVFATKSSAP